MCHELHPLMTTSEVAQRLHLGRTKVRELANSGQLRPIRIGRALRFRPQDVQAFIERDRHE